MREPDRRSPEATVAALVASRADASGADRSEQGGSPAVGADRADPLSTEMEPGGTRTGVWQALRLAHDRVARRLAIDLDRACGLALNEFDVLWHLHACPAGRARVGSLSEVVSLSQPALSRLVTRLEGRGLVSRSGASDDRRARVVLLTTTGTALVERATETYARAVHETLVAIGSDEDHATLLRTLARIGT